ncbi:hypothetical protein GJ496_008050 [Pomphorhynchus laevis]|nr:hypothetical protein GJ496_008050 [Pomphorhynchus laevis]
MLSSEQEHLSGEENDNLKEESNSKVDNDKSKSTVYMGKRMSSKDDCSLKSTWVVEDIQTDSGKPNSDAMKKRAVDKTENDEEPSKQTLPKKTRLFGSISQDNADVCGGNYFSKAINKLASQNINIKPLSSQKSNVSDEVSICNEDSRMSWTAEATSKQLFSSSGSKNVDVKGVLLETGEEDEETITALHGRLYMFSSECGTWKERGRGILKLNDKSEDSVEQPVALSRLVMRSSGTLRLLLNSNIFSKMDVSRTSSTSVRFSAQHGGGIRIFSIRASPEDCDQLVYELQYRIDQAVYSANNENRKTSVLTTLERKWLQVVFMKSCSLIADSCATSDNDDINAFQYLLSCDKYLKQTKSECDSIFNELTLINKNFTNPGIKSSKKHVFQICVDDLVSVKRLNDLSIEIAVDEASTYKLQFRDKSDADEVYADLQNTDSKKNNRDCESVQSGLEDVSSSSSYESVRDDTDEEDCSSEQSSEKIKPSVSTDN